MVSDLKASSESNDDFVSLLFAPLQEYAYSRVRNTIICIYFVNKYNIKYGPKCFCKTTATVIKSPIDIDF
jgi:hypothetical protein